MPGVSISRARPGGAFSPKFLALCALLPTLPDVAHAQSVNYAELEEMFGEPVTTSVTGKPQRASEAPAALVIITRDDIRRSPAHDIPGLIQAYAGIDVARWTAGQSDVVIRGGVLPFNPRLLVLVNGRQAYLDHYGMTNWAGLGVQLAEIQQIEIVKGPNSALFGFNAVSGVINIITVNPLHSQKVTMTGGVGTEGQVFASGVATIKLGSGLGLRLSGGYESAHELNGLNMSVIASQVSPVTFDPQHKEAAAELYAQLGDRTDGSVSITHSSNRQIELVPVPLTIPSCYRFTSAGARISHDTGWGVLSARIFQNWSDMRAVPVPTVEFHNRVLVASADALMRAGTANTVRLGVEYRLNELKSSPGYPGATRYDVFAASSMWETRLSDVATFTIAARVDRLELHQEGVVDQPTIFTKSDFDRSITEGSFNSALLLKLGESNALRFAASRGIRAPSLFAFGARLDFPIPGLPISSVTSGNPHIDPAKIWSGEIGLTHMLGENGNRLELTAFYNRTNDVMSNSAFQTPPRAAPPAYPFVLTTADNVGTFEAYGLEASVNGRFSPAWLWSLNYTWTHADQRIVGNANGHFERPLALDSATPEHKVKAQLSYKQGPWLATAAARYISATRQIVVIDPAANGPLALVKVEDSLTVDAKLAFGISDKLTLAITGENLTGADGAYLSPAPAERRLRASVQVDF